MAYPNPDDPTASPLFTDGSGSGSLRGAATPLPAVAPQNASTAAALPSTPNAAPSAPAALPSSGPVQVSAPAPMPAQPNLRASGVGGLTPYEQPSLMPQRLPDNNNFGLSSSFLPPNMTPSLPQAASTVYDAARSRAAATDQFLHRTLQPNPIPNPATQSQVRAVDNSLAAAAQPAGYALAGNGIAMGPPNVSAVPQPAGAAPGAPDTTSADRIAQMQRDSANLQSMVNTSLAAQPLNTTANKIGGDDYSNRNAGFNADAALRTAAAQGSWSPRGGYKGNQAAVEAAAIPVQNQAKLKEMSLKNQGDIRGEQIRAQTAKYGFDSSARTAANEQDVQRRGQDVTKYGYDSTARTAANSARIEQMNKDRTYNLDVQKFGVDQAKTNFEQRIKSREDVEKQIGGMVPAGADDKPDVSAHAAAMDSVNNAIAQRQYQLKQQIDRGGPNAAGAKAEADALEKDPYAALGQENIRKLVVGSRITSQAASTATGRFNPIGTSYSGSSAPVTSLKAPTSFMGDYTATHADGSTSSIPGRKLRDQNGNIPPDYQILMSK